MEVAASVAVAVYWLVIGAAGALYRASMAADAPRWVYVTIVLGGPLYFTLPVVVAAAGWVWGWRAETKGVWLIALGLAGLVHNVT